MLIKNKQTKERNEFLATIFSQQNIMANWMNSTLHGEDRIQMRGEILCDASTIEKFIASCSALRQECENLTNEHYDYHVALLMMFMHEFVPLTIPDFLARVQATVPQAAPQDIEMVLDIASRIGADEESYQTACRVSSSTLTPFQSVTELLFGRVEDVKSNRFIV